MEYSSRWKKADPEVIEEVLEEMRMMYYDGEIDITNDRFLRIEITKDSAGEDGWVYNWDVMIREDGRWVYALGDAFQYSEYELFDSLKKHGVI